jgi:hypothetical protein
MLLGVRLHRLKAKYDTYVFKFGRVDVCDLLEFIPDVSAGDRAHHVTGGTEEGSYPGITCRTMKGR